MDAGFIEVAGDDNREQLVAHFDGFEHGVQDTIRSGADGRQTPAEYRAPRVVNRVFRVSLDAGIRRRLGESRVRGDREPGSEAAGEVSGSALAVKWRFVRAAGH